MADFLKKLGNLISVKAIIALVLTGVYAYLSITGVITGDAFEKVFLLIIGFYFGAANAHKEVDKAEK